MPRKHKYLRPIQAGPIIGRTDRAVRSLLERCMNHPSPFALRALKQVAPKTPYDFNKVIRSTMRPDGRIEFWQVREDFIRAYAEIKAERFKAIKEKRETPKKPVGRPRKQERQDEQEVEIPITVLKEKEEYSPAPMTEEEKIHLIVSRADEITKDVLRSLLLELERKQEHITSTQGQLFEKEKQLQGLINTNAHLVNKTLESEWGRVEAPEQREEPSSSFAGFPQEEQTPATLAFNWDKNNADSLVEDMPHENAPFNEQVQDMWQKKEQEKSVRNIQRTLWSISFLLLVIAVLLILNISGII